MMEARDLLRSLKAAPFRVPDYSCHSDARAKRARRNPLSTAAIAVAKVSRLLTGLWVVRNDGGFGKVHRKALTFSISKEPS